MNFTWYWKQGWHDTFQPLIASLYCWYSNIGTVQKVTTQEMQNTWEIIQFSLFSGSWACLQNRCVFLNLHLNVTTARLFIKAFCRTLHNSSASRRCVQGEWWGVNADNCNWTTINNFFKKGGLPRAHFKYSNPYCHFVTAPGLFYFCVNY